MSTSPHHSRPTRDLLVVSHHARGGGTPLDSLWFSQESNARRGIRMRFVCARARHPHARQFAALMQAPRVIFDGVYSLRSVMSPLYSLSSVALRKPMAIYWHETEWMGDLAMKQRRVRAMVTHPRMVHFHVCHYGKEALHKRYGIPLERIRVLENITDPARLDFFEAPSPAIPGLFVACGRVDRRKGVDLFLDIAQQVTSVRPEARFMWMGGFTDEMPATWVRQTLAQRGLQSRVFFLGRVNEPTGLMAQAEAFMLTSRDDPMPKVLMEALALGRRCVSFRVCGVPELLGEYGTLVPVEDTASYAQALIDPPDEDASLQLARRRWYESRYTPEAFTERFDDVLRWWDERS